MHFGDLKWTPIIKGCDVAPVDGDMNAEGAPFVLRIRCSDGSKIPAHWHPTVIRPLTGAASQHNFAVLN